MVAQKQNENKKHLPIAAPRWNLWILLGLVITQVAFFILAGRHAMNFLVVVLSYVFWVLRGYAGQTVTPSVVCLFLGGSLLVNGLRAAAGIDLYSKLFNGFCILIWGFVFVYAKYRAIMYSREKAKQEWQKKRARAAQEACGDMHPYD